ncbi:hypothetical protein O9993_01750 [Vibrio lentus]|nr:hypothetical protein [Vibrio lentus]
MDKRLQTLKMVGSGPNAERQTGPHAHQSLFLKNSPQFVTVDLEPIRSAIALTKSKKFLDEPMPKSLSKYVQGMDLVT